MKIAPCPITYDMATGEFVVYADWSFPALGSVVTVPAGTVTDLASVPRWLRWLVGRFLFSVEAAVAHDHLYRTGGAPPRCEPARTFTQQESDWVFLILMLIGRVNDYLAIAAYRAVRRCGRWSWRS